MRIDDVLKSHGIGVGGGGGSNIKSIQRGVASLTSTSMTITISSIDTEKSIIIVDAHASSNFQNSYARTGVVGKINTSTQIELQIGDAYSSETVVYWTVIEFDNVKSLQKGTTYDIITADGSYYKHDVSIASVVPNKSMLFYTTKTNNSSTDTSNFDTGQLTSPTNIKFATRTSDSGREIHWQLIEFN